MNEESSSHCPLGNSYLARTLACNKREGVCVCVCVREREID